MAQCSTEGCREQATTWLRFIGMGEQLHVHVCPSDEAIDREWCDVAESGPLPCPGRLACTASAVLTATPSLLSSDGQVAEVPEDAP